MLKKAEANIGRKTQETLADAGYDTIILFYEAQEEGYSVLINEKRKQGTARKPYHASRFQYDRETDEVICPVGRKLQYSFL